MIRQRMTRDSASIAIVSALVVAVPALAQQDVPFNGGIPVAPSGLVQPLGNGPFEFRTGEDMDIRVTVITQAIETPWSLAFIGPNDMLVATRGGQIRRITNDRLQSAPVAGGPASFSGGVSGLPGAVHGYMDLVPHPDFADNRLLYLSYTKPVGEGRNALAVGRGRWTGSALDDFEDIYVGEPGTGGPSRIAFGLDGTLYFSASGGNSQTLDNIGGKVLRINDDGSIPKDNPFVDEEGALGEIFTLGHRNTLGLTVHPVTGAVWQNENGPNGGDEVNILEPGGNYGWPVVSLGRDYRGGWASRDNRGPTNGDFIGPVVYWTPAIAVSGMTWYTGDALPKWKGDLFVGGLRYGEIFGTGSLSRVLMNQNFEELRRESLLEELHQRIRDVRQGPDGLLYVITDETAGAVLRIAPAN
jgi:glucose/arabinose dehydrogenase